MTELTPQTLRHKWGAGLDEMDPNYGFIGIEGESICWVETMDPEDAKKIVDRHNAALDAWAADRARLEARVAVSDRMHDFLCKLFGSPDSLADAFSKECWTLMQDWTAPPDLAAGKEAPHE